MAIETVADLIDMLSELSPEAKIRIAHQSNYPLREVLGGVVSSGSPKVCSARCCEDDSECGCGDCWQCGGEEDEDTVWLVADGHPQAPESPYASKSLWNEI